MPKLNKIRGKFKGLIPGLKSKPKYQTVHSRSHAWPLAPSSSHLINIVVIVSDW